MPGGFGLGPVGGVDRIADPDRHAGLPQGEERPQGFLAARGNGNFLRRDGAGQVRVLGGNGLPQEGITGGRAVALLAFLGGQFGGGGAQGGGSHRGNGLGHIPDAEGNDTAVRMALSLLLGRGGDLGEEVIGLGEQGGVQR